LSCSELAPFLDFTINNVGDPFSDSNYGVNTYEFEREVLNFFADLLHAPSGQWWGYVTNGGTEGNMWGLYLARERYPQGVLYFSEETHYSVPKVASVLKMECKNIKSLPSGEIDVAALESVIDPQRPAIINANIGTTIKGAICNLKQIKGVLERKRVKERYIHCDAALFGAMLPFIDNAPPFDFREGIDSIAISGHKFLGSPIPCGIALARAEDVECVRKQVEYIGSHDCTISGSRDGFSALVIWLAINRLGRKGLRTAVEECYAMTSYTKEKLLSIGWHAWSNPFSNIVVLKRPPDRLIRRWQLATQGPWSHIVLMPHVKEVTIDQFVNELASASFAAIQHNDYTSG
jgi:histidine decarboxylase